MTAYISSVHAEAIVDSRGTPTLRVIVSSDTTHGVFEVPSGASTGSREAFELRDPDRGMTQALNALTHSIAPKLIGLDPTNQSLIDETLRTLDGTTNKHVLGGNTLIGVSIATARLGAQCQGIPLHEHLRSLLGADARPHTTPHLFVNLINGGKHAQGGSPIQEHQIITMSHDIQEAYEHACLIENTTRILLQERGYVYSSGDEGGVVFPIQDPREVFLILRNAIDHSHLGDAVTLGADSAASSFFSEGYYHLGTSRLSSTELTEWYTSLVADSGLTHLEDPFEERAQDDFSTLQQQHQNLMVIGDDLTTTNPETIRSAAEARAIRGVIIKPNQIGTLTETFAAIATAHAHNINCIISHRSGETHDTFIADLTHASGAYGMKAGAPRAPYRKEKYERLLALHRA